MADVSAGELLSKDDAKKGKKPGRFARFLGRIASYFTGGFDTR
jgi:hypothetical protein